MTKEKINKPAKAIWCFVVICLVSVLFVSAGSALTITSALPPDGEVGVAYNFDLQISGGTPPTKVGGFQLFGSSDVTRRANEAFNVASGEVRVWTYSHA